MKKLRLYKVSKNYLKYLHSVDSRVSVKFTNRPYVGVIAMINNNEYLLPLTSQTTALREQAGKKKRGAKTTTFVRDGSGEEIANILHNNMIPVFDAVYSELTIDVTVDTYESNEIRYIRKHGKSIIKKAISVYTKRLSGRDPFLQRICCDFQKLDIARDSYKSALSQK